MRNLVDRLILASANQRTLTFTQDELLTFRQKVQCQFSLIFPCDGRSMLLGAVHWVFAITWIALAINLSLLLAFNFRFSGFWFKCYVNQCPISVFQLTRLYINRLSVRKVVEAGIILKEGGFPVAWSELERAAIGGADLEKYAKAFLEANSRRLGLQFFDLVEADRADRLTQLFGR